MEIPKNLKSFKDLSVLKKMNQLDLFKEVSFVEDGPSVWQDRYNLPLFFIVGGADDHYLSDLMNISVDQLHQIIQEQSVDSGYLVEDDLSDLIGVFASRANLSKMVINSSQPTFARTFPLSAFLKKKWPILRDIQDSSSLDVKIPSTIEQTWIIRALRRNEQEELAEQVRSSMLEDIYPEKLSSEEIPKESQYSIQTLAAVNAKLNSHQRDYPVVILVDDLPIQLQLTLGQALDQVSLTGCATVNMDIIRTSLQLLTQS